MNDTSDKNRIVRVTREFKTTCFIWFAAPYSQSETVTVPTGANLYLTEYLDREEPYRFDVCPVDSEEWAPVLLSDNHRFDKNFRGSYQLQMTQEILDGCCEPLAGLPQEVAKPVRFYRAAQGSLMGTAIGDAIGLPFEGLSAHRLSKLNPLPLRHRFLFGCGMMSDDTEHSCIVANALILSAGEVNAFTGNLAWSLRFWFGGLPAGIGIATLKACLKLWLFIPANRSGVYSAGNGPAMRSAILGVYAFDDAELRQTLVAINTRITHRDPRALKGALIIAELAAKNCADTPLSVDDCLTSLSHIVAQDEELLDLINGAIISAKKGQSVGEYCAEIGQSKGVGGYIYHTLPVVLQIVLRHNDDYREAISEAVIAGGDTDTVAAIVGGIVGARTGVKGIPEEWIAGLWDWPRDKTYLRLLGEELAAVKHYNKPGRTQWMDPVRLLIRNSFFMVWVLAHGFRRLLPPY
jgi:ADP-ribosyl-[dinitrogen reductase] hydrolase